MSYISYNKLERLGEKMATSRKGESKTAGLPKHVYEWVIATVQGYEAMKKELEEIQNGTFIVPETSSTIKNLPRGLEIMTKAEREPMRRIDITTKVEAVEQAAFVIPVKHRRAVWENMIHGAPCPPGMNHTEFWRYKVNYYRTVAELMMWA